MCFLENRLSVIDYGIKLNWKESLSDEDKPGWMRKKHVSHVNVKHVSFARWVRLIELTINLNLERKQRGNKMRRFVQ